MSSLREQIRQILKGHVGLYALDYPVGDSVVDAIVRVVLESLPPLREPDGLAGGYQYLGYNSALQEVRELFDSVSSETPKPSKLDDVSGGHNEH